MDRDQFMREIKHELGRAVWHAEPGSVPETRFHSLFLRNPEPMWIYDVKTLRVLDVNQAAVERYGYSRDEFLGLTIEDLRPDEDIPKFREMTRDLPSFDRTGPWRHRLRNGEVIQVLITSHTVTYAGQAARLVLAENLKDDPGLDLDD